MLSRRVDPALNADLLLPVPRTRHQGPLAAPPGHQPSAIRSHGGRKASRLALAMRGALSLEFRTSVRSNLCRRLHTPSRPSRFDPIVQRGGASTRGGLLFRCTEPQPLLLDLENKSPPPKRSRVTRVTRRLPGEPPAPNLPGQPPAPNSPAQKCLAATGHVEEKRNTHGSSDWLPEGPPRRSRRSSPSQQAKRSRVIHDPAAMCPRRPT